MGRSLIIGASERGSIKECHWEKVYVRTGMQRPFLRSNGWSMGKINEKDGRYDNMSKTKCELLQNEKYLPKHIETYHGFHK